jgi:hypothetical protein
VSPRSKKVLRNVLLAMIVAFAAIQFVPVRDIGSNPPARYQMDAPPEVAHILRRACFDCHSNETRWPLYSRMAPGSWLMSRDVHKGRAHHNFSEWGDVDEDERQTDRENCWEQIEAGNMPPWFYIYPMHLSARLSAADKALLKDYLLKGSAKKPAGDAANQPAK